MVRQDRVKKREAHSRCVQRLYSCVFCHRESAERPVAVLFDSWRYEVSKRITAPVRSGSNVSINKSTAPPRRACCRIAPVSDSARSCSSRGSQRAETARPGDARPWQQLFCRSGELPKGKVGAVSAESALAWPERLDRTRPEGRTGEDRRIERESSAKDAAAQPWLGHAGHTGTARTEILGEA